MAEFFQNFRHLFDDAKDMEYTSQLKALNHAVEQSRREVINSEKRRQLGQASSILGSVILDSPFANPSNHAAAGVNADRQSFNKHGTIGGLFRGGEDDTKSKKGFKNHSQMFQNNNVLSQNTMNHRNQSSISTFFNDDYPQSIRQAQDLMKRKNGNHTDMDGEENIFQDPLSVAKLRSIMLSDQTSNNQQDHYARGKNGLNFQQDSYDQQHVGYSKKKKNLEFAGHNILNPLSFPVEEERSKNLQQERKNNKAVVSMPLLTKTQLQDLQNKKPPEILRMPTPVLDSDYVYSSEVYDTLRRELDFNSGATMASQKRKKNGQGDANGEQREKSPHPIESLHKGLDKYQTFKRSQMSQGSPLPKSSLANTLDLEKDSVSPIRRRFIASRQFERKDRIADLLTQQETQKI